MKTYYNNSNNNKTENNKKTYSKPVEQTQKEERTYSYYSRVLKEPFESLSELKEAEEAYYAKLKAKEDQAAQKRADAKRVEDAFKALNAARKTYKETLSQLTTEYSEALTDLKKAFEAGKADIQATLAKAETTYSTALKEFTSKYPEGYHLTLKDGDFETTISGSQIKSQAQPKAATADKKEADDLTKLFNLLFGF